jgi:glycosyltransferase involved in cell wall biosynthesis
LRIVHYNLTTTTKEGGVETFVWDLAREQARAGHRVTIVSGRGPVRRDVPGVEVKTAAYVDRNRFAFGPLRRAWALRKLAERLTMLPRGWLLVGRPDLVHIHKPYDLPLALLLRPMGVPVFYHGHGEGFFPGDRPLAKLAAALLSCSTFNAETLKARYGREAIVVFNGVDVEHFRPREPDRELRARLAASARHVVLMPGRFMPWKGQADVLDAFALARDLSARLVLIGDGETRAALEKRAAGLGLADRVVFAGTLPHREMPRYLATGDVVLGASVASETFGMALAEAMACGRPVLASSWRGYDDVVVAGETGERFPAGDPRALAQSLRRLLEDERGRARLAAAGRKRVESLFRWEVVAARVQAVYDGALRRRRASP